MQFSLKDYNKLNADINLMKTCNWNPCIYVSQRLYLCDTTMLHSTQSNLIMLIVVRVKLHFILTFSFYIIVATNILFWSNVKIYHLQDKIYIYIYVYILICLTLIIVIMMHILSLVYHANFMKMHFLIVCKLLVLFCLYRLLRIL